MPTIYKNRVHMIQSLRVEEEKSERDNDKLGAEQLHEIIYQLEQTSAPPEECVETATRNIRSTFKEQLADALAFVDTLGIE